MSKSVKQYFALNKPFGYLCQFSGEKSDLLLGQLYNFPKDVYSIGRLDKDSEGLLLLTNDNALKTRILDPKSKLVKTYWAQVDGQITKDALEELSSGTIVIKHNGKSHKVMPAEAIEIHPDISERTPPIRVRKNIPTSWVELKITEGKNRQVRKMTAAVGFPTLRLIRVGIGNISLDNLESGSVRTFNPNTL